MADAHVIAFIEEFIPIGDTSLLKGGNLLELIIRFLMKIGYGGLGSVDIGMLKELIRTNMQSDIDEKGMRYVLTQFDNGSLWTIAIMKWLETCGFEFAVTEIRCCAMLHSNIKTIRPLNGSDPTDHLIIVCVHEILNDEPVWYLVDAQEEKRMQYLAELIASH